MAIDLQTQVQITFSYLAIRSVQSPPVGTDNHYVVISPGPPADKAGLVITAYQKLTQRLGPNWDVYITDDYIIAFSKSRFGTGSKVASWWLENEDKIVGVEWNDSDLGHGNARNLRKIVDRTECKRVTDPNEPCMICFETVSRNNYVVRLGCNHWAHEQCMEDWARVKDTCPRCRENVIALAMASGIYKAA